MLIIPVRLREIPNRALRLVIVSAAKNPAAGMFIDVFVRPLPNIAYQIHHSERARAGRVTVYLVWSAQRSALIRRRNGGSLPLVAPRIRPPIEPLYCKLPFPLVG